MPKVAWYNGKKVFHAESNVVNCRFNVGDICEKIKEVSDKENAGGNPEDMTASFMAFDKNGACVEISDCTGVYPADKSKRVLVGERKIDIAHHIYHMKVVRVVYMGIIYCRMICTARGCKDFGEVFSSFKLHTPCYYGHNYMLECDHVRNLLEFLDYDTEVYPAMDSQDIRDDVDEILDVAVDTRDPQAEMFVSVMFKNDFQFGLVSSEYLKYAAMTLAQRNCVHVFNTYVSALDIHVKKSFVDHGDQVDEGKIMASISEFQKNNPHVNDCFLHLFPQSVIVEYESKK